MRRVLHKLLNKSEHGGLAMAFEKWNEVVEYEQAEEERNALELEEKNRIEKEIAIRQAEIAHKKELAHRVVDRILKQTLSKAIQGWKFYLIEAKRERKIHVVQEDLDTTVIIH